MEISRDEWNLLYKAVEKGFDGIHARLDDLNGRTRESENAIAVLEARAEDDKVTHWIDRGVGALVAGLLGYFQFKK